MQVSAAKKAMRARVANLLAAMSVAAIDRESALVCAKLVATPEWARARSVRGAAAFVV